MAGESAREVAARSREKAERLLRRADMFERGAEGEARTAAVLQRLPEEWTTLNDVRWPGRRFANIDHIVIGPGGIFVVDSKNWSGSITVDASTVRQNGRRREPAIAACADSALAIAERCGTQAANVHPVLCLVRDEQVSGWSGDVLVCSTAKLREMLLTRPRVLTSQEVVHASLALEAQLRSAMAIAPTARGTSPALAQRRRRHTQGQVSRTGSGAGSSRGSRTRRRSGGRSLSRFIIAVAMMLGLAVLTPHLSQFTDAIGEAFVGLATDSSRVNAPCPEGDRPKARSAC